MLTTCLLGNGVSLAYNPALRVDRLTADLVQRFTELGATEPERALAAYAAQLAVVPGEHFEPLLGPLVATSNALGYVPGLAALTDQGPARIAAALQTVSDFLRTVHRIGMAVTLGHIAERTIGGAWEEGIWPVADALIQLGAARELTVGTLNYDGLLHSGLMEAGTNVWGTTTFEIADLADGRHAAEATCEVVPGRHLLGHRLRSSADLPADRASLIQLHGSLGWLRHPEGVIYRFSLPDLRDAAYWSERQAGRTEWEPVVVLTDRKDSAVEGWPFSMAYSTFFGRLLTANRWLIVGYGLGDAPVNAVYDAAVRERSRQGLRATPPTLVVGCGGDDSDLRERAVHALGLHASAVVASADGVPAVFEKEAWQEWAAAPAVP